MIKPSLVIGDGNWGIKANALLGYKEATNGEWYAKEGVLARNSIGTYVGKDGLIKTAIANTPRIDYLNNVSGGLLLEEQRTNLITYSWDFSNSYWVKQNLVVGANIIAPDGTLNGYKLIASNSLGRHNIAKPSQTIVGGYRYSVFAKAGEYDFLLISSHSTSAIPQRGTYFDLTNGIIGTSSGGNPKIEDYGNGWYRCSISENGVLDSSVFTLQVVSGDGVDDFIGDGTSGIYVWGAQRELSSYATSYIPTNGASATRLADACNSFGISSDFNSEEGVIYLKLKAPANDLVSRRLSINDKSNLKTFQIAQSNSVSNAWVFTESTGSFNKTVVVPDITQYVKTAFKYKLNDFSVWIEGVEVATDLVATTFPINTINNLSFDRGDGTFNFYGSVASLKVYKTAPTNQQLLELTTDGFITTP